MAFGLYDASAPVFVRALTNLSALMDKALSQGFDEVKLLEARLAPDMRPFSSQIQLASDSSKGAVARLSGTENPPMADTETSFAELKGRIDATIAFIKSVDKSAFGCAERPPRTVPAARAARPRGRDRSATRSSPAPDGRHGAAPPADHGRASAAGRRLGRRHERRGLRAPVAGLSEVMDAADPIAGEYLLEVSSPASTAP
jgi:hypothetical protein